jgi:hypothetical protein
MLSKCVRGFNALSITFALAVGIAPLNAHAVFIDFDDITALPGNPFSCDDFACGTILGTEYEAMGVLFGNAWLSGERFPDGTNQNSVVALNELWITFVGTLPNFINFNVDSALRKEASFFHVYGKNDELLFAQHSSGWMGEDEPSTPYIPGELISITSENPIKRLTLTSLYNMRVGPTIDNLTFEYRTVPEPSLALLFIMGIAGFFWRRKYEAFLKG